MKKQFLFLLVAVVLASTAYAAQNFDATVTVEEDRVYEKIGESAYFDVTVTNKQSVPDVFTISTAEFEWLLDTDEQLGELGPARSRTVTVSLEPKEDVPPGVHRIGIKVRSANSREFEDIPLLVTVLSADNLTYRPSIALRVDTLDSIDPREPMMLSIYMRNRNARVYAADELTVLIESELFTKEYRTGLGRVGEDGEKTNQVPIVLDSHTVPGTHDLKVTLIADDNVVSSFETQFTVNAFDNTKTTQTEEDSFFKTTTTYVVENEGNIRQEESVLHDTSLLKRLFTSSSARYDVQEVEGKSMLVFNINLEPSQQAEITVTENYRLLFILAVIVALSIASYFLFRSPVVLRKEAIIYGGSADGVSMLKIRLFIKNRSAKSLHNLHVIDKVTSMADVVKDNALGTLHPTKIIRKKGHGTLIRWDVDTLEPFEERIITYQVRTQLKLIGDVYLPAMKVKFDQKGRERTTYSNEVNIPREG